MTSKEYIVADNGHWSMQMVVDAHGVYLGTKSANSYPESRGLGYRGLYLTIDEQDELLFRLIQARRKRKNA